MRFRSTTLNNAIDHAVSSIGLTQMLTLAHSALPDAPVVPDIPRDSLANRARRAIDTTRRFVGRPAPVLPENPVMTQG